MAILKDTLMEALKIIKPQQQIEFTNNLVYAGGCGCSGNCGQSCAGGCESGCSGNCGRSCSGRCS